MDRAELRNLIESYGAYADSGERTRIAELFTPDAELVVALNPGAAPTAIRHGRAEIADAMVGLSRYVTTSHIIANVQAALAGDEATGQVGCVAHHIEGADGAQRDRVLYIRYHDAYTRHEGAWRFAKREVRVLAVEKRPLQID